VKEEIFWEVNGAIMVFAMLSIFFFWGADNTFNIGPESLPSM
jgi:hypothetical protein